MSRSLSQCVVTVKALGRRLDEVVSGVLLAALVVVVSLQVLFRYVVYQPMSWTEEAGRYLFIWLCMAGAAVGVKAGAHLGIDVLIRTLPPRWSRRLGVLIAALSGLFCAALAVWGAQLVLFTMGQTSPGLGIPMGVPYLAIPLGAALMAVYFGQRAYRLLRPARLSGDAERVWPGS